MDLRGTDFMVSPGMLWTSIGNDAVHRVDISAVILKIVHCGHCSYIHCVPIKVNS